MTNKPIKGGQGSAGPLTLLDKIWAAHVVATNQQGVDLLHIDRSLLTDLSGAAALEEMERDGLAVPNPELHLAMPDHAIATTASSMAERSEVEQRFVGGLERLTDRHGVRRFDRGSGRQGIVHVVGLETGFSLPGATVVCGDSHTSTHGAIGALAWGVGTAEVKHVLATQTHWIQKPRSARIRLVGELSCDVGAKDAALWIIGELGVDFGVGHAIEFTGPVVERFSVESRATLCNLAIELGARFGLVAPDAKTFEYLQRRLFAPKGEEWRTAVAAWSGLTTDDNAVFDLEIELDLSGLRPQISWGVTPAQVLPIGGAIPSGDGAPAEALAYMGVEEGQRLGGLPVDIVFIGSCANSRIEDLRAAAEVVRGRKVAATVDAWVVPGSEAVKSQAEAEGLAALFREAGFQWREPGCSMCVAANGDLAPPGKRVVSTSNRNFIGRQGPDARTHLASPTTAAACAVAGVIISADQLEEANQRRRHGQWTRSR